jgi:iron-sulfur cluster assembly accessory protein
VRTLSTLEALNNTLIVTKSCAKRIQALKATASQPDLRLRISVEGGGCSGFQYKFEMDVEELEEDDMIFQRDGCEVVVDESSFDLIRGSTIDYEQELIRSAFAVVNNPQSESACGCGSSFALKNFEANPALD